MAMDKKRDRQTVALPGAVMDTTRELSALASKHGWSSLGVDREDPPTMVAIIEEAVKMLAARAKTKGKK
jgi:hypothetical protein